MNIGGGCRLQFTWNDLSGRDWNEVKTQTGKSEGNEVLLIMMVGVGWGGTSPGRVSFPTDRDQWCRCVFGWTRRDKGLRRVVDLLPDRSSPTRRSKGSVVSLFLSYFRCEENLISSSKFYFIVTVNNVRRTFRLVIFRSVRKLTKYWKTDLKFFSPTRATE